MVYYFTASNGCMLYMGKDKYENENLIKYAWPDRDIWFHVDDLSSAHVYLRLPEGHSGKSADIPTEVINQCAQLVKANSIVGCKKDRVSVCYTPCKNLKKTKSMEAGQVSFFKEKQVKHLNVDKDKAIVNALNKTKVEEYPDLEGELRGYMHSLKIARKEKMRKQQQEVKELKKKRKEEAELRSYSALFEDDVMADLACEQASIVATQDASAAVAFEEDFM
eukprot:TRINITY_DN778153_c0_g1_i1.p1 TRINITY_DN778153_c0_g1~~TRINITY_DN778153_c0_g1_i1.p1  ORF type:complete len:231 (-),score=59.38 TRINITY_DN778153_c0_g1_i1:85-747(-)